MINMAPIKTVTNLTATRTYATALQNVNLVVVTESVNDKREKIVREYLEPVEPITVYKGQTFERLTYVKDAFWELIKTRSPFSEPCPFFNGKSDYTEISFLKAKNFKLKPENLICVDNSDYFLFNPFTLMPIPIVLQYGYIESFREEKEDPRWDYKKLIAKLKTLKEVIFLEEAEIPYYNSEFSGQMGIKKLLILPTQEQTEKVWERAKDLKYPTSRYKEAFTCHNRFLDNVDPLGIKDCLVGKA